MGKPFKFRHVNEIAGAFVIAAIVLLLAGVFVAGRSQGWFERRLTVRCIVDSEEGLFGLQEGNEVHVRNLVAGKVARIMPREDGSVEAEFVALERFRPFIRKDSVARIKRKFAIAGDAFVEIERGSGLPVEDGDLLACVKDEELIETAQAMLEGVRGRLFPMLEEVHGILARVNSIVGGLEKGQGPAGALLRDEALADSLRVAVRGANDLLFESRDAVHETTRLIRGVQRHWLIRKYVRQVDASRLVYPSDADGPGRDYDVRRARELLDEARLADDSAVAGRHAYNLGMLCLASGAEADAAGLVAEMRAQPSAAGETPVLASLLEAHLLKRQGQLAGATAAALDAQRRTSRRTDADVRLRVHAALVDLFCEAGEVDRARGALKEARGLARDDDSPEAAALSSGLQGRVLLCAGDAVEAGEAFDVQASLLREAAAYGAMAAALQAAGEAYERAGRVLPAADRYYRSGRSLLTGGQPEAAKAALGRALPLAEKAGNEPLARQITALREQADADGQAAPAASGQPNGPAASGEGLPPRSGEDGGAGKKDAGKEDA